MSTSPATHRARASDLPGTRDSTGSAHSLWVAGGFAFALLLGAWIALFTLVARHRVDEVAIEPRPATTH